MKDFLKKIYEVGEVELYLDIPYATINTLVRVSRIEETETTFELIDPESNSFLFNKEDVTFENANICRIGNAELKLC